MKAIRKILLAVTMLTAFGAQSAIYSYITRSDGTPSNAKYWWTIEYWDTNDATPNPCYRWPQCTVFIGHRHSDAGEAGPGVSDGGEYLDGIQNYATVGDVGAAFQRKYALPRSGTQNHVGPAVTQECVGIYFKSTTGTTNAGGSAMMSSSLCGIVPPPVGKCAFTETSIELTHGQVQLKNIEGNQARQTGYIRCTQDMDVVVYAAGAGGNGMVNLRSDGSLQSRLTIGGKSGSEGAQVHAPAGIKVPLEFVSTLARVSNVEAGDFFGSATAILTVP
ncbi:MULTISPECIES: MrpH family fimbial adhesin [unclassified Serratia (in: enterobacteria)]|uniref:MrpH family fimbial adhesin n=2 Tax=Serratia TaxID=613 RepID=UPI00307622D5